MRVGVHIERPPSYDLDTVSHDFGDLGTVSALALSKLATVEVGYAAAGLPLRAFEIDPAMATPPEDVGAAHYRAAYYLAQAARVAASRGQDRGGLVKAASGQLWWGNMMASPVSPYRLLDLFGAGPGAGAGGARAVLEDAAKVALAAGVPEAIAPLKKIASQSAIMRAHDAAAAQRWDRRFFDSLGVSPGTQTAIKVGILVMGAGIALWGLSPYFSAAASTVKAAERATRGARKAAGKMARKAHTRAKARYAVGRYA